MKQVIRFPGGVQGDVSARYDPAWNGIVVVWECEHDVKVTFVMSPEDTSELVEKLLTALEEATGRDAT